MKRFLHPLLKRLIPVAFGLGPALAAVTPAGAQPGPAINGSITTIPSGSTVNLTSEGQIDWVHWGLYTETSLNRKAAVVPQISDFVPVDAPNGFVFIYQFGDNANGYSWSDGAPTQSVTETTTGVWAYGTPLIGSGFRISAPADTAMRALKVYVGAFKARGKLEAYLSDGSARGYTNSSLFNTGNGPSSVYTLTYSAASPGQELIVVWTLLMPAGPDGNVTLQAAALTSSTANNPPFARFTSPTNNATFAADGNLTLLVDANDLDGSVANVEFYRGATKLGEDGESPYTYEWNNLPAGVHELTATVTDNEGAVSTSSPVEIFVNGTGGSLVGDRALPPVLPSAVNLTSEGSRDWVHWGLETNSLMNRKAGVVAQISDFTKIGTNAVERYDDNYTAFGWTDGTPAMSAGGTTTGVFTYGLKDGFELRVPADTAGRTLKVYVGLYGARGNFQAWLSDYSAPAYTDSSFSNVGNSYAVYQVDFRAATSGQHLIVRYRSAALLDGDFGNVTLQAATLAAADQPPAVTILNPSLNGTALSFSFATESGRSYTVQFSEVLPAILWQALTNLTGDGASAVIVDSPANDPRRFYRVLIQ